MSDNEQTRMIATAMNEGSPQARALGFSTLEIGEATAVGHPERVMAARMRPPGVRRIEVKARRHGRLICELEARERARVPEAGDAMGECAECLDRVGSGVSVPGITHVGTSVG